MSIFQGRKINDPPPIVLPPTGILKWSDDFHGDQLSDLFPKDGSLWSGMQKDGGGELGLGFSKGEAVTCLAPPGAKACVYKEGLGFRAGMDFWCSFQLILDGLPPAPNVAIMDLENSTLTGNPGRRLFFKQDPGQPLHLILEGKHAGATFRQSTPVEFPRGRWVKLVVHYHFAGWSNDTAKAELYQNDRMIIGASGASPYGGLLMPVVDPQAVYDRLSVGLTKNDSPDVQVAYVGAVKIGTSASEVS